MLITAFTGTTKEVYSHWSLVFSTCQRQNTNDSRLYWPLRPWRRNIFEHTISDILSILIFIVVSIDNSTGMHKKTRYPISFEISARLEDRSVHSITRQFGLCSITDSLNAEVWIQILATANCIRVVIILLWIHVTKDFLHSLSGGRHGCYIIISRIRSQQNQYLVLRCSVV